MVVENVEALTNSDYSSPEATTTFPKLDRFIGYILVGFGGDTNDATLS